MTMQLRVADTFPHIFIDRHPMALGRATTPLVERGMVGGDRADMGLRMVGGDGWRMSYIFDTFLSR